MAEDQHHDAGKLNIGEIAADGEVMAPTAVIAGNHVAVKALDSDDMPEALDPESDSTRSLSSTSSTREVIENQSNGLHTPWGDLSHANYDVITVHGLRDYHSTAWRSNKRDSWVRSSLFKDISIRQLDFFYAINDSARIYQNEGIKAEGEDLMREYIEKRRYLPETELNRPIVWLCHDIGGSIVKKALIQATRATNREDYNDLETWERVRDARRRIATSSTAIIFIGCPHRPRPLDVLQEGLCKLMMLPGPEVGSGLIKKIQILASQVNEINIHFIETKFLSRIVNINVYDCAFADPGCEGDETSASNMKETTIFESDELTAGMNDQHIANDEASSTITSIARVAVDPSLVTEEEPGYPFGRYTLTLGGTFELCCRFGQPWVDHLSLVETGGISRGIWAEIHSMLFIHQYYPLTISTKLNHGQIALLSMMPPRKVPTAHLHIDIKGNQNLPVMVWIADQVAYQKLFEDHKPQILNIEFTEGNWWRTSILSQSLYDMHERNLFTKTRENNNASFYFQFDKSDTRYNTIESMLITFIAEISCRHWHKLQDSPTIHRVFDSLRYFRCWSLENLFKLFTELRKCASVNKITLILSCWESCAEEQRTWFLSRVLEQHRRSDLDYRLVITTTGPDKYLNENIQDSQVISLKHCPMSIEEYAIDRKDPPDGLTLVLEELLQKRPALKEIKELLSQMMHECQETSFLGYVILNWLARFGRALSLSDISIAVQQLRPITPDHILATIIEKYSPRKQKLACIIYRWVRYAMEPLTIEALGHAVAISLPSDYPSFLDIDYEDLLDSLDRLFCGIIVLDGREVKFSHESFYSCSPVPQLDDDNSALAESTHGELAKACLSYLLQEEILQNRYANYLAENHGGGLDKCLLFRPRDDLLDYAVQQWATHYQLSNQYRPIDLALNFFQNKQARNKWAEAHYLLSNPFTRIHRSYISPLPMIAALGLEDVIMRQIQEEEKSKWFQNDCWLAITEAGRNGHSSVVRQLLSHVQVQALELQDAIYWSTSSDNQEIIAELLDKVTSLDGFTFPISILSLASAAGLEELVSIILKQRNFNPSEPNPEIGNQTALHVAVHWDQKTIAELLLASGADAGAKDAKGETPLLLTMSVGGPEIVQLLVEKEQNVIGDSKLGISLINAAITSGELAALKCVLLAGADCTTGQFDPSDDELRYPIIHAAAYGRIGCLGLLLENGVDPCTEANEGSALYILSNNLQAIGICRTLLEKSAVHQGYLDKEMLLCRALRANNKQLIELLIEKGTQFDIADTYGEEKPRTLLSFASIECSVETLKFLLDKGADPNYRPEIASIYSTLFYAAYHCREITKVELLLNRGADIHWRRSDGWTPLHAAYDMPALVSLLLDHGSDVNSMSSDGTILMMAARWNYLDTIIVLLSREASVLELNAKFNWKEDPSYPDYGKTALDLAVENGCHECARLLFEVGATIDAKSMAIKHIIRSKIDNDSELHALTVLFYCLQRGLQIDTTEENNKTALHYIRKDTPMSLVESLIDWGCQVHALDSDGFTPLAAAVRNGNIEAVQCLLGKGARADDDRNLLFLALKFPPSDPDDIIEMLEILIAAGADPLQHSRDALQESLLHVAIRNFQGTSAYKLCQYLIREVQLNVNIQSGQDEYPIIVAADLRKWELVEYLIRHKADCDVADDQGRRPLHYIASSYSDEGLFELISRSGADLQAPDNFGRTPLHLAAGYGYRDSLKALISSLPEGFDVNVRDSDGWTPLMWACKLDNSNWGVVRDLVTKHNADISVKSTDGRWSPLKLAYFSDMDTQTKQLLTTAAGSGSDHLDPDTFQYYDIPAIVRWGWRCDGCLLASRGQRYECRTCIVSVSLCFKCYPKRSEMHEPGHDFEEYRSSLSRSQTESDETESDLDEADLKVEEIAELKTDDACYVALEEAA